MSHKILFLPILFVFYLNCTLQVDSLYLFVVAVVFCFMLILFDRFFVFKFCRSLPFHFVSEMLCVITKQIKRADLVLFSSK